MALNTELTQGVLDIIFWIWIEWGSLTIDILIPSIQLFQLNGMGMGEGVSWTGAHMRPDYWCPMRLQYSVSIKYTLHSGLWLYQYQNAYDAYNPWLYSN